MPQFISVDHSECTGCRECEVVCSLYHYGECNPERSAIRVNRTEKDGLVEPVPVVCQQCERATCVEACPTEALFKDSVTGAVTIDSENCTGCEECNDACPAGCISIDRRNTVAVLCDLCGGRPQCIDLCHSHSLTLKNTDDGNQKDRLVTLTKVLTERLEHQD